jgi:CRISPR-associated protein Cmr6
MRPALSKLSVAGASHAGHALSCLLAHKQSGHEEAQKGDLHSVTTFRVPDAYAAALERWQAATADAVRLSATTRGPLALGLGNASPYEVGLTLHHTFGVPYLPGSALKGLARRAALQQGLTEKDEAFRVLFGDVGSAGHVAFWDGWMDAGAGQPLQLDTITVHHPKYYQNGQEWPTDFDDPTPVAFLSVRPGVKFHLRLSGPGEWASLAARLVAHGLEYLGLGGKTNAGYGGFAVGEIHRPLTAEEIAARKAEQDGIAAEKRVGQIREALKNARAISENSARVLGQIAALPLTQRQAAVDAVAEQARKFGEKDLARKARKLLEEE